MLTGGTQYWVIAYGADSTSFIIWNSNSNQVGGVADQVGGYVINDVYMPPTWVYQPNEPTVDFDVLGTPITATPESGGTLLFLGLDIAGIFGLGALTGILRRKALVTAQP